MLEPITRSRFIIDDVELEKRSTRKNESLILMNIMKL